MGHTIDMLELSGFEVHDVEAWREHYALTTQHWYRGLMAHREEAIKSVGIEKFRPVRVAPKGHDIPAQGNALG